MSAPIAVSYSSLQATQESLQRAFTNINQQLDDLKSYLLPMVESWTGQAASNYQDKQKQWEHSAEELQDILTRIDKALGQANDGYQQTEAKNAGRW